MADKKTSHGFFMCKPTRQPVTLEEANPAIAFRFKRWETRGSELQTFFNRGAEEMSSRGISNSTYAPG